ncbi:hydrogenase expression/formation protein [Helicobacter aurati]|uniref:Hydrogenase expression/formation protein n=1 Tax=Helicobacter aurati TaxID=137778 RepID=A0A3D8J588_9HELI|nr:HyaD/HybD family hydrogenase maturation endopeptidase [Helicobacter aurati]RDU71951.1 hydrogenase expression/formation protein [Helicobacter aurati]
MKLLVLGIGNILFGDEGIGVHLCNSLKVNYEFTSTDKTIDFVDGGTLANTLIPLIVEYDHVLIMDCVNVVNAEIGTVYSFGFDKVPNYITWAGSAHEVEMLQTLHLTKLMGDLPNVHIIGIIPEIIGEDTAFNLSKSLLEGAVTMEQEAISYIASLGFLVKKIQSIPLQEIANQSYRGF